MSVISMKQLLEAGVHFGHQTRRWNPKMAPYIYTERNGIYIIDLQQSVGMVDDAYNAIADIVADGGSILFVGTKKQAQDAIKTEAERCGMFYVNERWLGGMLTNFKTIQSRIARLKEIETMEADGTFDVLPKKEVIELRKELVKLQKNLGSPGRGNDRGELDGASLCVFWQIGRETGPGDDEIGSVFDAAADVFLVVGQGAHDIDADDAAV